MTRRVLSEAQWAIIEPFCLGKPGDPGQTGRDPRLFVEAVLWIVRTGAQWRELPVELGKCKNRTEETEKLTGGLPDGAAVFVLDERGKPLTSRQLSQTLARLRDDGLPSAVFLIGGADGFEPSALPPGVRKISFGTQTWPHKLVRVMLAEQIYRALTILAGSPYHRD